MNVLSASLKLQYFLKAASNLDDWMEEKMEIAEDESYLDPTNLQSKTKRHDTFSAEVFANETTLEAVCSQGQ